MANTRRKKKKQQYIAGEMGPRPVDVYVGGRLRERRTLVGLSQEKLAEAVNLTFQQIQKYERGTNRISVSRLYELSRILKASPSWFFEGYNARVESKDEPYLCKRETLELVRSYERLPDEVKKPLRALITAASRSGSRE